MEYEIRIALTICLRTSNTSFFAIKFCGIPTSNTTSNFLKSFTHDLQHKTQTCMQCSRSMLQICKGIRSTDIPVVQTTWNVEFVF